MIVKIKSTNPNALSILRKNRDSFLGIQLREMYNGVAIGKIVSDTEYHMVFQDTKYSFVWDKSNQIDYQSYCNPRAFLAMTGLFLGHLQKESTAYLASEIPWLNSTTDKIDTEEYSCHLHIPNIYADSIDKKRGSVLQKYFPEITFQHKIADLYSLDVKSTSIFRTINIASLAIMFIAASNKERWFLTDELIAKYIRIAKNVYPIPYFMVYMLIRKCINNYKVFLRFKDDLKSLCSQDVDFEYGSTQEMRLNKVWDILQNDGTIKENIITEIGCGELDYARRFLPKLNGDIIWRAFDKQDFSANANNIRDDRLKFSMDFDPSNVKDSACLMIEVIEHMPFNESIDLVVDVLKNNPNRLIISTPNFDFNKYYEIERFRHDDHKFELSEEQFASFILLAVDRSGLKYKTTFFGIGDKVNESYISNGCLIERI